MAKSNKAKLHQWYHFDTSKGTEKWQRIHHWYHFDTNGPYHLYSLIYIWHSDVTQRELMTSKTVMRDDWELKAEIEHPSQGVRQKDKNKLVKRLLKKGSWDTTTR